MASMHYRSCLVCARAAGVTISGVGHAHDNTDVWNFLSESLVRRKGDRELQGRAEELQKCVRDVLPPKLEVRGGT